MLQEAKCSTTLFKPLLNFTGMVVNLWLWMLENPLEEFPCYGIQNLVRS